MAASRSPGFYDDVKEPAAAELESWKTLPFRKEDFSRNEVGSTELTGEPDRSVLERVWSRPTLEVHGIAGGFTGAGAKTVIPSKATAKVSFRLVPDQDPEKLIASFKTVRRRQHASRHKGRGSRAKRRSCGDG